MKYIVVILALFISGCATTPQMTGDGWFDVRQNESGEITALVKQLEPLKTTYNNGVVNLDRWTIKLQNSGTSPMCVRLTIMYIDYFVDVPSNWILVRENTTINVGMLTQDPLILLEGIEALSDSVWKIDNMETLQYVENRGCEVVVND